MNNTPFTTKDPLLDAIRAITNAPVVDEAIAYAQSSANSNAEFERNQPKVPSGFKGVHTETLGDHGTFREKATRNLAKMAMTTKANIIHKLSKWCIYPRLWILQN
jgi:hypothetical protein